MSGAKKMNEFIIPWHSRYYAPVSTDYGTIQTHWMRISAKAAWEDFLRGTHRTKEQAIADGYTVRRLKIELG